jgi:hypothetical protein
MLVQPLNRVNCHHLQAVVCNPMGRLADDLTEGTHSFRVELAYTNISL